jgi:RING finger and CHY zinc finger domain-containing protein 1
MSSVSLGVYNKIFDRHVILYGSSNHARPPDVSRNLSGMGLSEGEQLDCSECDVTLPENPVRKPVFADPSTISVLGPNDGNDPSRPLQYIDKKSGRRRPGCKHYASFCEQKPICCDKYFACRRCHNEAVENDPSVVTHVMDRFKVQSLRCTRCGHEQPATYRKEDETCQSCNNPFASYACHRCMLFHEGDDLDMYHCDLCRICRLGKKEDNFHCTTCDACVAKKPKKEHACNEYSLKGDCPVCAMGLYWSVDPVVFLPCGHALHEHCFKELSKHDYRCCLCLKSMTDMSGYFQQLDKVMAIEMKNMPPEFASKKVKILCHECGGRSTVPFHFDRWKCSNVVEATHPGETSRVCGSYNTRLV